MIRSLLDLVFWLAVSLYFGGILVLGIIVAPAVFDTTRSAHINLPGIAAPLDPAAQAGGEIFGNILQRFAWLELAALIALLLAILGWLRLERLRRVSTWAIAILWLTVVGIAAYDAVSLTPRIWKARQELRNTAAAHTPDSPGTLWPERQVFDALHRLSESQAHFRAYVLLAMVALAAWRKPFAPPTPPASTSPAADKPADAPPHIPSPKP